MLRVLLTHGTNDKPADTAMVADVIRAALPDAAVTTMFHDWRARFARVGNDWDKWVSHMMLASAMGSNEHNYNVIVFTSRDLTYVHAMIANYAFRTGRVVLYCAVKVNKETKQPTITEVARATHIRLKEADAKPDDPPTSPLDYARLELEIP